MKKLMILAGALLAFATFTPTANAEPENPIVRGTMNVTIVGKGQVTGTGITCPSDCTDSQAWQDNQPEPTNRLVANANVAGWAFSAWEGCVVVAGQPTRCDAFYGNNDVGPSEITARFADVMAPTTAITAPANGTVTRQVLNADVTATDNDRVARVVYSIDGTEVLTRTVAPWGASLDVSGWAEGEHTIVARAFDPTGNNSVTAGRTFRVDKTAPQVEFTNPAVATNAAQPSFAFTSASADFSQALCSITQADQPASWEGCTPGAWYAKDAPAEGDWKFEVKVFDHPGNQAEYLHEFVVDRAAPEMSFTSGPADGATVETGDVAYAWTTNDALAVNQICSWDDGEQKPCVDKAGRALTKGTHSFKVVGTDAAGNVTTLTRTVNVKKDGTGPLDPDPNDPTGDKTPPRIKLIAPKQKLKNLSKALRIKVRCSEACKGQIKVKGKGGVTFAGKVGLAKAGVAKLKLKPKAKVKRKLKKLTVRGLRSKRKLTLTATVKLKDPAGNAAASKLKFKVAR